MFKLPLFLCIKIILSEYILLGGIKYVKKKKKKHNIRVKW